MVFWGGLIKIRKRKKVYSMRETTVLKTEEGSVLVISLVMLVLLTLIGISATTTSEIETQIAGNEKAHKENLYLAEAGAIDCGQLMSTADLTVSHSWLKGSYDDSDWDSAPQSTVNTNTRYLAVSEGVVKGASLGLGGSRVYSYAIYGRTDRGNLGRSIVRIGYRKAF